MKIAYVFLWHIAKEDGVSKKIRAQVRVWESEGHEVLPICITDEDEVESDECFEIVKLETRAGILRRFSSEKEVRKAVLRQLDGFDPDLVYMRQTARVGLVRAIAGSSRVVVEVNSEEVRQLRLLARSSRKLKHWIRYWWVMLNMKRTYGAVSGIVSVTHRMAGSDQYGRFGKPVTVLPNGIDLEKSGGQVAALPLGDGDRAARVVFIGGTYDAPWHGIDLICELAKATAGELDFHVIGPRQESENLPPNVTEYGYLDQAGSLGVFARCDVGFSTCALFRKDMEEACPLKVRDYLAAGLPVVFPYSDTALLRDDGSEIEVDWALRVPNREDGLSSMRDEIVAFCRRWRGRRVPADETASLIDSRALERRRLAFFNEICERR